MKICFISEAHSYHTQYWAKALSLTGSNIELLSPTSSKIPGVTVHTIDLYDSHPFRCVSNTIRVRQRLSGLNPDVHHLFGLFAVSSLLTMPLIYRIPKLIVSVWGSDVVSYQAQPSFKEMWVRRFILNQADIVTATSKYLANEVKKYVKNPRKIVVIPWGVDIAQFSQPLRRFRNNKINFGFAKRLHSLAGPDILIDAFKLLCDRDLSHHLVLHIAGDGPMVDALKKRVQELTFQDRFVFHGWVLPGEEMAAFLQTLDVFVMPSRQEAYGVAAVEAMASGLPVIASDCGGIPEIVEHEKSGLLVKPEDPAGLADAMFRLCMDSKLRLRMGIHGRNKVLNKFDERLTISKFTACYSSLIGCKRSINPATK